MGDIGHGTVFEFGAFTGELRSISWDGMEAAEIDVTHMGSEDGWQEFIPGLKNAGEISLNLLFDPSVSPPIAETGTAIITFPNGRKWSCDAYCSGAGEEIPHDDVMEQDITFKLTGAPNFNHGS